MFRFATIREQECLLICMDQKLPQRDACANPELIESKYKYHLNQTILLKMQERGTIFFSASLQRAEIVSEMKSKLPCECHLKKLSCDKCKLFCVKSTEGVLSIVERDYVQLLHGKQSALLENREGVQFLLAGITLALLYESIPKVDDVLSELFIQTIVVMMDSSTWIRSLEMCGPASRRVTELVFNPALVLKVSLLLFLLDIRYFIFRYIYIYIYIYI